MTEEIKPTEIVEVQPKLMHVTVPENSPAGVMMALMSHGANLEQIGKAMDLQERWAKGEAEKAYNRAFAAFKAEAVKVIKRQTVMTGPLVGKTYAGLHDVVSAVTPALSMLGLSASWKLTKDEKDWLEVTCTLKHVDGHSESVSMGGQPDSGGAKNALQARASTKAYLERYTLKAILGVAEQDDDTDGNPPPAAIPDNLLDSARSASLEGWAALSKFIKGLTEEERTLLEPESESLKKAAKRADADRSGNAVA
jgi:hypothetical protein